MNISRSLPRLVATIIAITSSSILAEPPPANYPRYRLVDLGTLGGASSHAAEGAVSLNNRGEMVAFSATTTPDPFPDTPFQDGTIWHSIVGTADGTVRDLSGINGNHSLPIWISNSGLVTGFGENGQFDHLAGFPQVRALFWDAKQHLFDLGTLGGNSSQGESVNSRGQVVGQATNGVPEDPGVASYFNAGIPAAQQVRAFLWQNGVMSDLGTLGGNDAAASAINESGDIAGFSATATGTVHPFLSTGGLMRDLGTLGGSIATPGGFSYPPFGPVMNARGEIAGTSYLEGDNEWHGFIWSRGRMIDLGTLGGNISEAIALNDAGLVVRPAPLTTEPTSRRPFVWATGRL